MKEEKTAEEEEEEEGGGVKGGGSEDIDLCGGGERTGCRVWFGSERVYTADKTVRRTPGNRKLYVRVVYEYKQFK